MDLAGSYLVVSHQNVYLPLIFADSAVHTVKFWVVLALNHAIVLKMPFLHKFNPSLN